MSKPSEQAGKREPRFEEAIAQIEELIERIESGETGLEESIANYERGMKLLGRCQVVLNTLEQKVALLTAESNGKLSVEDELEVVPEEEEGTAERPPAPRGKSAGKAKPASDAPPTGSGKADIAEEDIPF